MSALALDLAALESIRSALRDRIEEGLAQDGREIRALLTYLLPARRGLAGRALAVDCGGTNLRAAIVELGATDRIIAGPVTGTVPTGRDGALVSRSDFFLAHSELVERLGPVHGLPIGYCFSYPTASLPDHDATLIHWTKGVRVEGVEGTRVGAGLRAALAAQDLRPGPVAVLNDTVASLLSGCRLSDVPERTLGLIVGTGTNMASFVAKDAIKKLAAPWSGPMAVNLESGNFHPPHLTEWDDALDATTDNPGRQRFEKAVSGHYLPKLLHAMVPAYAAKDAGELVQWSYGNDERGALARAILDRSADLVAAALAAAADLYDGAAPIGVLAEGGLFWNAPGYRARVEAKLSALGRWLEIRRQKDANLFGAAAAVLAAAPH